MNRKQIAIALIVVSAVCFALYLYGRDCQGKEIKRSFEDKQNDLAYNYMALYTARKSNCFFY